MPHKTGGIKRSSLHTFRRRLLLIRRLLRGQARKEQLLACVQQEMGSEGYPHAASSALKHDLDTLKHEYGCVLHYDRSTGMYVLESLGTLTLLDLPDECMEALSFLETSFPPDSGLSEYTNIRALIDRILLLLPPEHRDQMSHHESTVRMSFATISFAAIDQTVLQMIKRAIKRHQCLEFDYLSTFDEHEPRRHRVAPYAIFFSPEGHGYLDATLLHVAPAGDEPRYAAINYRINRIVTGSVLILPDVVPPERPQPATYLLQYRLVPVVARRRDVAAYFPNTHITYNPDGSAFVTASVTNLWQTRQILLRYGTGCEVLAPPELIVLFRDTARGLAEIYRPDE